MDNRSALRACAGWLSRALCPLAVVAAASSANAQSHEFRVGAGYAPHTPEQGASFGFEYIGGPINKLKSVGSPRPFAGARFSLDGYTNYAQAGLMWRFGQKRTYLDLGAGLSVHDGALSLPHPEPGLSDEENRRRRHDLKEDIEFDTRAVFFATFALGMRLNERWAVELQGHHWSNGQLGSSTHDGADSLGVGVAYRF